MHPCLQLISQGRIDHAVLLHPGQALKRFCTDFDSKMAFSLWVAASMACMLMAFINHAKGQRVEGCLQLVFKGSSDRSQIHNVAYCL